MSACWTTKRDEQSNARELRVARFLMVSLFGRNRVIAGVLLSKTGGLRSPMLSIANAEFGSLIDFDHGEGWVTFSWSDASGIACSLTIDIDGHCSREMPVRSGTGVEIATVLPDRVRLRFTDQLSARLELDRELEFVGRIPENAYSDLRRLAEYF